MKGRPKGLGSKSPLGASIKGEEASVSREVGARVSCKREVRSEVSAYLRALIINANVKVLKGSPRGLLKGRRLRDKQCCIVLIVMKRQSRKSVRRTS